jgi:large subunit ribosomal protein L35
MPKTKTSSSVKKRFKVTAGGKLLRRRRHRTTPPGHLVKSKPGKRKRGREGARVARSDEKAVKKMIGRKRIL